MQFELHVMEILIKSLANKNLKLNYKLNYKLNWCVKSINKDW